MRLVFLGTPDFAVATLDALFSEGYELAVVTAPDKPAGRGMKLQESAVKKYAIQKDLQLLQPARLKDPTFLDQLKSFQADLHVVVAFRMLPESVWNMPPLGTINLHASLLPQYRGAAPINWAIINGENETGVTTFKLKHEIDTGNILMQQRTPIGPEETAGELHDRLKALGSNLVVKTVKGMEDGSIKEIPQPQNQSLNAPLKLAPKIFTETCRIEWQKSIDEVHNLIRGLSPYPGAFTVVNDKILKVYRSLKESASPHLSPGAIETDKRTYLKFACADGFIQATEVQIEGKKRMTVEEFLRGYKV